jgi:Mg-chelatase subunit ChlD
VVDVSAPDVSQGETANVTATIENTGDTAGTQRVSLSTEGAAARGASKLDIVFVVDDSANMWPEMEDAKEHVRNFSSQLDRADVDARYALVSFTNEPEVDQAYTSDGSEFQDSVDRLTPTEDGTASEDAWDAIRMALELEAREDSTPVVILITDGPAYYNDVWHDFSDLTRSQVASLIDEANASLITVTSLESSNDVASSQGDTTALAGDVADGTHFDLVKYDYGGPISDEIATELIERSRTQAVSLALAPGESARVSYSVSTDDVPPGAYNITVATENDSGSTTLTVTN